MSADWTARGRATMLVVAVLLMLSPSAVPLAFAEDAPVAEPDPWGARVDELLDDLVQLRLEKVLADSDTVLREAGLPDESRTEVWILRSQAHVALGDLDAAAKDFEEILRVRPEFEPEPALMTPAATKRFGKIHAGMIGNLRFEITPVDASVVVDGRSRDAARSGGIVAVLAGERDVRLERSGHDAWVETVTVEPGKEVFLQVRLVPNARTVTFVTDQPDVAIEIDGLEVGRTASAANDVRTGMRSISALTIENIPLGEHAFAFVRPCFRTVRRTEMLNIDILDPAPLTLPLVKMQPAFAMLSISGEPSGARIKIDGEFVGTVPAESIRMCPGARVVDVERDGNLMYRTEVDVTDGVPVRLDVDPRPNVALVGIDRFPVGFEAMADSFNIAERRPLSEVGSELATPEGWVRLGLDREVHLGFAVVSSGRPGETARRFLYSPILGTVERIDAPPARPGRPSWSANTVGAVVVDTRVGGPARVAAVRAGGPADSSGLRVGDRILEVGDVPISGADAFRRAVEGSAPGATLGLLVQGADGANRELPLVGRSSPRVAGAGGDSGSAATRAAWAYQHAFAFPADSAAALANLGRVLEDGGRPTLALAAWRRVRWPDRAGVGPGTMAYHVGRLLLAEGHESEAATAFREAATSRATDGDDDGPTVASAAKDYLADLGVSIDDH